MFVFLIIIGIIFFPRNNKSKPHKSSAIIVKGDRSPRYYEIMEEEYSELKKQLQNDAKNGVIYKKSKKMNLQDFLNKVQPVYEDFPASEALKEFEEYERNGYM